MPEELKERLNQIADVPLAKLKGKRHGILRKVAALNALSSLESDAATGAAARNVHFWKAPWGEPEWVMVPAGEFLMGSKIWMDAPMHHVFVAEFKIARVPVTNAQYALFVRDNQAEGPRHWSGGRPPKEKENHPVVDISWRDAQAYCCWLSSKLGYNVQLPTEAECEKAARGDHDRREFPWGDTWEELRCNSDKLGLEDTSPVGLFLSGASPSGVLDMVGNV
jgi:formylglycine-generating enzyme required for sulfatase activity